VPAVLELLRDEVGLTERAIARAVGVTDRTVRRWNVGGPITTDNVERLDDLKTLVTQLASLGLSPPTIVAWLHGRNPFLQDRRPLDVLASGDFDAASGAVSALRDGSYA